MRLFLSWSGHRSRALAAALKDLLPDAVQGIVPWMSDHDIEAGARWGSELSRQLDECDFGILCLTAENAKAPWLLFEAGALSKSVDSSHVVPYCLGIKPAQIQFPIGQFQGVEATRDGTLSLISSLHTVSASELGIDQIHRVFGRWWPDFKLHLDKIPGLDAADETGAGYSVTILIDTSGEERQLRQDITSSTTIQDVVERLFLVLRNTVEPISYLDSWILTEVNTGINLVVEEIASLVPAHHVLRRGSTWRVQHLEKPYCKADYNDVKRWYRAHEKLGHESG